MIIYDPIITGSFQINGSTISSVESIDAVSQSVADLKTDSGSFSTRVSLVETSANSLNQASSSYALKTGISGSFTSVSSSLASRIASNEGSVDSLNSASSSYLLNTTDTLDGNLTVTGTITAQEFHTEFVSASIIYQSGSTKFGNSADDVHQFTGSLNINGYTTFTKSDDSRIFITDSGDSSTLVLRADATNEIYTSTNHDLQIYTNGNQNGQIFLKQSNGFVGIGDINPDNKLHVNSGTTNIVAKFESTDGTGGIALVDSTGNVELTTSGTNGFNIQPGGGSTVFRVDGDGKVGIGEPTPSDKLHITNTLGDAGILLEGPSQTLRIDQNSIRTTTTSPINIFTNNTSGANSLYIGNDGRFGVGTATPTAGTKLDVAGKIRATDDLILAQTNPRIDFDGGNTGYLRFLSTSTGNVTLKMLSNGDVGINGDPISFGNYRYLTINGASATQGGVVYLRTSDASHTAEMYVDSDGFSIAGNNAGQKMFLKTVGTTKVTIDANGNVGIGTTNPNFGKLNIWDTTAGSSVKTVVDITNGTDINLNIKLTDVGHPAPYAELASYSTRPLVLNYNQGGNVGIGTTSPSKKLDVVGDWKLGNISGGYFGDYGYGTELNIAGLTSGGWARANKITTSDSAGTIFFGAFGDTTTLDRAYWTIGNPASVDTTGYASSNGIILLKDGRVGIGKTLPAAKLDVNGNGIFRVGGSATNTGDFTIANDNCSTTVSSWSLASTPIFFINSENTDSPHIGLNMSVDYADGPKIIGYKSRGSAANNTSVLNGDDILSIQAWPLHTAGPNQYKFGGGMTWYKDDGGGTANTYAPVSLKWVMSNSTTTTINAMTLDYAGRVTKPYQVYFIASHSDTLSVTSAGNILVFNTANKNVGGGYDTTNGRFTAPIAGRYLFTFTASVSSGAGDYEYNAVYILYNGGGTYYRFRVPGNLPSGKWAGYSGTAILDMAANDYIQLDSYTSAGTITLATYEAIFSGYLLG